MTVKIIDEMFGREYGVRFNCNGGKVRVGRLGDVRLRITDSNFYGTEEDLIENVKSYNGVSREHFSLKVVDGNIIFVLSEQHSMIFLEPTVP